VNNTGIKKGSIMKKRHFEEKTESVQHV